MGNKSSSNVEYDSMEEESRPMCSSEEPGAGDDLGESILQCIQRTARPRSRQDETDGAAMEVNPDEWEYPFENLVLEGGGNKGMAFVGLVKCLEERGIMPQIKRFSGASAGSMAAMFVALGYTGDELGELLSEDLKSLFVDHRFGVLSLVPNLMNSFGWNPAMRFYNWMTDLIKKKSANKNPDMTFYDLYRERGVELCVIVANMNQMRPQMCHPKTTPDMPIREAVRMSMSIPIFFKAWFYSYPGSGDKDVFVDGGTLNNYPINCYDGWGLSMKKEDSYIKRLQPLSKIYENLESEFTEFNVKTVGALLFDETERDVMRYNLEKRVGVDEPEMPSRETDLYQKRHPDTDEFVGKMKRHNMFLEAADAFLTALSKNDAVEYTKEMVTTALEALTARQARVLFPKAHDPDSVMEMFDKNHTGTISIQEALYVLEKHGVHIRECIYGYGRQEIENFEQFLGAMNNSSAIVIKQLTTQAKDELRTVGINTGYVRTMDFELEEEDKEFVVARGYNATEAFLKYFVVQKPDLVKKKEVVPVSKDVVSNSQNGDVAQNGNVAQNDDVPCNEGKDGGPCEIDTGKSVTYRAHAVENPDVTDAPSPNGNVEDGEETKKSI